MAVSGYSERRWSLKPRLHRCDRTNWTEAAPSPDWNCLWDPSGGRGPYSLYPRHVRASVLPNKRLSTHTMHFRRVTCGIRLSCLLLIAFMEYRVAIWSSIFNTKKCPKIPKFLSGDPDGTWSVQLFLPGPWRFLLGPCPRGPHPGDGAGRKLL